MKKEELKKLREFFGLSPERFARSLGVDVSVVTLWENGKEIPKGLCYNILEAMVSKIVRKERKSEELTKGFEIFKLLREIYER